MNPSPCPQLRQSVCWAIVRLRGKGQFSKHLVKVQFYIAYFSDRFTPILNTKHGNRYDC